MQALDMSNNCEQCTSSYDGKGRGYLYAVITAIVCPCHLPLVGLFLGSSAAGVLFAQNFFWIAIFMGALFLISLIAAIRILL